MRTLLRAMLVLAALALPSLAQAQVYPNIPANTVLGRTGVNPGPPQPIPFATLAGALNLAMSGDCTLSLTDVITCTKTNGSAFGTFATQNYATPPAIGGTTPAAGSFSGLTDTSITGSTQCVQANSSGAFSGAGTPCGGGSPVGGRLVADNAACTSDLPVQNANFSFANAICYVPYKSNSVPINGVNYTFSGQQLTMTGAVSTDIYDIYEIVVSGSAVIAFDTAPWTNSTTPANPKKFANGVWTNTNTISTLKNNGSTLATSVTSGNATYLGSFYATASGDTTWNPTPTPASGGTNNCLCLFNAYNQVPVNFLVRDSVSTFTFGSAVDGTWEFFDNNQNNEVTILDGLGFASYNFNFQLAMSMDSANPNKGQVAGAGAICIDCIITGSPATPNNPIGGWGTQGGCGAWTAISTNANAGSACGASTNGFFAFPGIGYGGGSLPTQSPLGLHTFALAISGNNACTSCTTTGPLWYGSIAGAFGGQIQD